MAARTHIISKCARVEGDDKALSDLIEAVQGSKGDARREKSGRHYYYYCHFNGTVC